MLAGSEITTSGTSKPTSVPRFSPDQGEDGEETTEENRGFLQLLQTGELADVDVVVGDRIFHCHKAILGAKSPFFKAAFVHDMKEKATGKITIDGEIDIANIGGFSNLIICFQVWTATPLMTCLSIATEERLRTLKRSATSF